MEDKEKDVKDTKEIDLIDVFASIGRWFCEMVKSIFSFLGWLLRVAVQEKIIVIAFLFIGCAVGFFLSMNKTYKGEVEMRINSHDSYYYKNLIDPLYEQCKYRDIEKIAQEFEMTKEQAKKIVKIKSYFYIDVLCDDTPDKIDYKEKFDPSDTTETIMADRLRIEVYSQDSSLFRNLTDNFRQFFAKNPQIVKENELRKRQLNERIEAIEKEIVVLDSLRRKEYFERKRDVQLSTDKMVLVEREIRLYHEDVLRLEKEKQELAWRRDVFEDGVSFASQFETSPHATNGRLKLTAICGMAGLLLGVIAASVYVRRKEITTYLKKEV